LAVRFSPVQLRTPYRFENRDALDVYAVYASEIDCPEGAHIQILRVPPEMVSAEDAIVWVNHGIHPDEFAVQT
jgi:leucine-rich repeat protein SHOC2